MFASVLGEVTGQLDKRFILNAFFPTLVFALLMALVIVSGTSGVDEAVKAWDEEQAVVQTLIVIGAVAVVLVAANVLAASMLAITRLFEGYALLVRPLQGMGRRHQFHRWQSIRAEEREAAGQAGPDLAHDALGATARERFPLPKAIDEEDELRADDFAATRLGNILRNAETYPRQRYGLDPVRTWPLLYHLLGDTLRTSLDEARASMEFLLVVAFWAGVYSPVASISLLCFDASTGWVLGALLGGAGVSAFAYLAALAPASVYNSHVRAAFDMHRLEVLQALRIPPPATLAEERLVWPRVIPFLDRGTEHTWRFVKAE